MKYDEPPKTKQERREDRRLKRKGAMPVHGKRLVNVYKRLVEKWGEEHPR